MRIDTAAIEPWPEIVSRALEVSGGDRFDFVAFISNVTTNGNRHYLALRNDVTGIGLPLTDQSAPFGGTGRLRGLLVFPLDASFDGADHAMIHETGHAWINFATDQTLGAGRPHWPPSTMALGVMGMSIPGSGAGGEFPWSMTWLGNGTARVQSATPTDHFTPLDLYLMGVLSPDSVPDVTVLAPSVDPLGLANGDIVAASTYTMQDYIAAMGTRTPTSATAPCAFSVLCLVASYGRLLTGAEMAFFEAACGRAETTTPLPTSIGLANGMSSGFFLATGGRATLTTRLP